MWINIETNPTWRGIQRVRQLTRLVITGKKPLQWSSGCRRAAS
jgi:hypothetical protein